MYVIVDTLQYGLNPTDKEIADCAEKHGMFQNCEEAIVKAECLPVNPEDIMLVDIDVDCKIVQ